MSPASPGGGLSGLPGRLLSGAVVLLLAAWALSEAVQLVTRIWVPLVVIAVVVSAVVGAVAWWRRRDGGW